MVYRGFGKGMPQNKSTAWGILPVVSTWGSKTSVPSNDDLEFLIWVRCSEILGMAPLGFPTKSSLFGF